MPVGTNNWEQVENALKIGSKRLGCLQKKILTSVANSERITNFLAIETVKNHSIRCYDIYHLLKLHEAVQVRFNCQFDFQSALVLKVHDLLILKI